MTDAPPLPPLPHRDPSAHKGTFGTVAVIGGRADSEAHMLGGPALAALAALRAGCGLVRLAMPATMLDAALVLAPAATGVPIGVQEGGEIAGHSASEVVDRLAVEAACLAIGPGLGTSDGARSAALRAVWQNDTPVVVDADALNCLAQIPELQRDFHAQAVLTPHPGEYRRLAHTLGVDADPTDPAARPAACAHLAQRLGCVVALKGAGTVVSDGHRTWIDTCANPALATAGSGDVLTGVIASLIAQHHRRPIPAGARTVTSEARGGLSLFDCARLGVRIHATAADAWTAHTHATGGMLATDLLDRIPAASERLRGDQP